MKQYHVSNWGFNLETGAFSCVPQVLLGASDTLKIVNLPSRSLCFEAKQNSRKHGLKVPNDLYCKHVDTDIHQK